MGPEEIGISSSPESIESPETDEVESLLYWPNSLAASLTSLISASSESLSSKVLMPANSSIFFFSLDTKKLRFSKLIT